MPPSLDSLLHSASRHDFIERFSLVLEHLQVPGHPLTPQLLSQALHAVVQADAQLSVDILNVINQHWAEQSSHDSTALIGLLHTLVSNGAASAETVIELVDKTLLQEASIISSSQILATRSVRMNTGLLYKQQKFNLLREENEGYAKLSHEFNVALSELPKSGLIEKSDLAVKSDELLTVVNALIGYFELDPNRVLDNILDICSQNLLSHSRFILHFLHHSPWAPTTLAVDRPFAELEQIHKRSRLDSIQDDFVRYYNDQMANDGGSTLAAELLGFKLRFFATIVSSKDRNQTAPDSLIFLVALLIKSGFIKLSDIYPYVPPNAVLSLILLVASK
jgi:THO complex subunit 2